MDLELLFEICRNLAENKTWVEGIYHNKQCPRQNWTRPYLPISSKTVLSVVLCVSKMWVIMKKVDTEGYVKIYVGNIFTWAHPKQGNLGAEWRILITEVPLGLASYITRFTYYRWATAVVKWCPRDQNQLIEGTPWQWEDKIIKWFRPTWRRRVRTRTKCDCIMALGVGNLRCLDQ